MPLPPPNEQKIRVERRSGMDAMSVKLDDMLEGLDVLKQHASNGIAFQARMDERMAAMDIKLSRVEKTLFGNGDPGVGEQLRAHDKRLSSIEINCRKDINKETLDDIAERHAKEDEEVKKQEQVKVQKVTDQRKFIYALWTMIATAVIDILMRILHI